MQFIRGVLEESVTRIVNHSSIESDGAVTVIFRADRGQFYYLIITKRKVNEILRGNNWGIGVRSIIL